MFTLERGASVIHLFGTIHLVPEESHEDVKRISRAVRRAIRESDVMYGELGWVEMDDRGETWLLRSGAGAKTLGDTIDEWEESRRALFLHNLAEFPQLDHVGRRDELLQLAPYAARDYLAGVLTRVARLDGRPAIDTWVMGRAYEVGIEIRGLEELSEREALFAALDQERIATEIEELLAMQPSESLVRERFRPLSEEMYDAWAAGQFAWPIPVERTAARLLYPDAGLMEPDPAHSSAVIEECEDLWMRRLSEYFDAFEPNGATAFVAVGASHVDPAIGTFLGRLEADGWTVTRRIPQMPLIGAR